MTTESLAPAVVRERERKFDIDGDRPVPRLDGVGPVATQLEPERMVLDASYFDTADHRLLRADVSLRRRTGGTDAGWHLKVPAESGFRDEVRLPLQAGDTTVPRELADRVDVDAHDLVEIAHIRTERHSYDLLDQARRRLATLADDHVTAELAGTVAHLDGWRELEIELEPIADAGLLDLLGDAVTRAGARPAHWSSKLRRLLGPDLAEPVKVSKRSSAGEVVMAYLRAQVDALRRHDIGMRHDEEDAVHQARVAMRRLRSALTTFRRVLDRDRTRDLSDELRWAAGVLSDARDIEVLRALFAAELPALGATTDVSTATATLTHHFDQSEARARAAALEMLNGPRYAALLGALETLLDAPPLAPAADGTARKELRRALARAHRRLNDAVDSLAGAADGAATDEGLHEVRKKAKQARYAADTAEPAFGRRLRRWRKSAKAIQTTLGEYHDLVEARALLDRLWRADAVSAETGFVLGRLYERACARAETLHEQFTRQWRHFPEPQ